MGTAAVLATLQMLRASSRAALRNFIVKEVMCFR